jgi:hypothetical protein
LASSSSMRTVQGGFLDGHGRHRHVLVSGLVGHGHGLDLVDHLHAGHDLAEHRVAVAVARVGLVEEGVVLHVDEELCRGGIGVHRAGHREGAAHVGQAAAAFQRDRRAGGLLAHVRLHPATLDHEVLDHAVEDGAVVVAGLDVLDEVVDGLGRLGAVKLDNDVAQAGGQLHLLLGPGGQGGEQAGRRSDDNGGKTGFHGSVAPGHARGGRYTGLRILSSGPLHPVATWPLSLFTTWHCDCTTR